jgi:hypothetical protein
MAFTGTEDHTISLADASAMTQNFRNTLTSSAGTIAHFFGKAAIEAILAQEDCVGIRIYYGLNATQEKQLIVVGADANEDDLYKGLLAEKSLLCPSCCSSPNPLNT